MANECILAIDQGTTSSRALVFDAALRVVAIARQEFEQRYPRPGRVEHDPEVLWRSTLRVAREAMASAEADGARVVAVGIANQRETTLLWERSTGRAVHNAIVWQDRRTAAFCEQLARTGVEPEITARTGLILDPYFSASKLHWLLEHVNGARAGADAGRLAFGTVDSYLIWRLTGGRVHVTDVTNASRTSLYNIGELGWDDALLELFDVPAAVLPEVLDCAAHFGTTEAEIFGRPLPILGVAGDQQAAAIGHGCFAAGDTKVTYGTGAFLLINTGERLRQSRHRLLGTVAWRLDGRAVYALEGSLFVAGAAVQWLRDELGIIGTAAESEALAASVPDNGGVYLVPAFTGLGAPHWDAGARGVLCGLDRSTNRAHLARAALEASCYQTQDLLQALREDGLEPTGLRIDGGMSANRFFVQTLADIVDLEVARPGTPETTALGAACLAGREAGLFGDFAEFARQLPAPERFAPQLPAARRTALIEGWRDALTRTLSAAPRRR